MCNWLMDPELWLPRRSEKIISDFKSMRKWNIVLGKYAQDQFDLDERASKEVYLQGIRLK